MDYAVRLNKTGDEFLVFMPNAAGIRAKLQEATNEVKANCEGLTISVTYELILTKYVDA
jgi:hypothetical protein